MPRADDIRWFKQQFRGQIERELTGTPFDLDMIIAIACQETGYIWSVLRKKPLPLDRVVALCVGVAFAVTGAIIACVRSSAHAPVGFVLSPDFFPTSLLTSATPPPNSSPPTALRI